MDENLYGRQLELRVSNAGLHREACAPRDGDWQAVIGSNLDTMEGGRSRKEPFGRKEEDLDKFFFSASQPGILGLRGAMWASCHTETGSTTRSNLDLTRKEE
jgi:hypothetical protein